MRLLLASIAYLVSAFGKQIEIGGERFDIETGGCNCSLDVEIAHIQDVSGSLKTFLAGFKDQADDFTRELGKLFPYSKMSLACFIDKPVPFLGFGWGDYDRANGRRDFCYTLDARFLDKTALSDSIKFLDKGQGGNDMAGNQFGAIINTVNDSILNWTKRSPRNTIRVVSLITDNVSHGLDRNTSPKLFGSAEWPDRDEIKGADLQYTASTWNKTYGTDNVRKTSDQFRYSRYCNKGSSSLKDYLALGPKVQSGAQLTAQERKRWVNVVYDCNPDNFYEYIGVDGPEELAKRTHNGKYLKEKYCVNTEYPDANLAEEAMKSVNAVPLIMIPSIEENQTKEMRDNHKYIYGCRSYDNDECVKEFYMNTIDAKIQTVDINRNVNKFLAQYLQNLQYIVGEQCGCANIDPNSGPTISIKELKNGYAISAKENKDGIHVNVKLPPNMSRGDELFLYLARTEGGKKSWQYSVSLDELRDRRKQIKLDPIKPDGEYRMAAIIRHSNNVYSDSSNRLEFAVDSVAPKAFKISVPAAVGGIVSDSVKRNDVNVQFDIPSGTQKGDKFVVLFEGPKGKSKDSSIIRKQDITRGIYKFRINDDIAAYGRYEIKAYIEDVAGNIARALNTVVLYVVHEDNTPTLEVFSVVPHKSGSSKFTTSSKEPRVTVKVNGDSKGYTVKGSIDGGAETDMVYRSGLWNYMGINVDKDSKLLFKATLYNKHKLPAREATATIIVDLSFSFISSDKTSVEQSQTYQFYTAKANRPAESLSYKLSGSDAASFSINNKGELSVTRPIPSGDFRTRKLTIIAESYGDRISMLLSITVVKATNTAPTDFKAVVREQQKRLEPYQNKRIGNEDIASLTAVHTLKDGKSVTVSSLPDNLHILVHDQRNRIIKDFKLRPPMSDSISHSYLNSHSIKGVSSFNPDRLAVIVLQTSTSNVFLIAIDIGGGSGTGNNRARALNNQKADLDATITQANNDVIVWSAQAKYNIFDREGGYLGKKVRWSQSAGKKGQYHTTVSVEATSATNGASWRLDSKDLYYCEFKSNTAQRSYVRDQRFGYPSRFNGVKSHNVYKLPGKAGVVVVYVGQKPKTEGCTLAAKQTYRKDAGSNVDLVTSNNELTYPTLLFFSNYDTNFNLSWIELGVLYMKTGRLDSSATGKPIQLSHLNGLKVDSVVATKINYDSMVKYSCTLNNGEHRFYIADIRGNWYYEDIIYPKKTVIDLRSVDDIDKGDVHKISVVGKYADAFVRLTNKSIELDPYKVSYSDFPLKLTVRVTDQRGMYVDKKMHIYEYANHGLKQNP